MNVKAWYQKRGMQFILERAKNLNERYSLNSRKSIDRIESCVSMLRAWDCYPTFAVPGLVVEHHFPFIRHLQDMGAEIAVHGYNHVDLQVYPSAEASRQLEHAAEVFQANGLEVHGFRCPYLSVTDDLIKAIPPGIFAYSSNKAIQWFAGSSSLPENLLYDTIKGFYVPVGAESNLSLPWFQDGLIEIPVCVPDDLQLHDGLGYELEQVAQVWLDILHKTYQRGELFNLMFHPELASFCESPFLVVLQEAARLKPGVWVTRLCDVSDWWKEKAAFRVETEFMDDSVTLKFHCPPRAVIVSRGLDLHDQTKEWDTTYQRLEARFIKIPGCPLPFIGLEPDTPSWIPSSLSSAGFIVDDSETASRCGLYLDQARLAYCHNPVELMDMIDCSTAPLVRFWPWPAGMHSALCITGDLDALSIVDYARRLWSSNGFRSYKDGRG